MPVHESAKKRMRQNPKRRLRNKQRKARVRTRINQFFDAVEEGDVEAAEEALRNAESELMRAAAKNTIHKRRAARKVGRMAERLQYLRDGNKEKALEEPRI